MVRKIPRMIAALPVIWGMAIWSVEAPAQTATPAVTPEAASALADALNAGLLRWFPTPHQNKGGVKWTGKVSATPVGDHYDVRLPSVAIVDSDNSKIQVGEIAMIVKPNADQTFGVEITLPASIQSVTSAGAKDAELSMGSQHFSGVWSPTLETFIKIDAAYSDLAVVPSKPNPSVKIGLLAVRADLAQSAPNRWSGPSSFTIGDLLVQDEKGVNVLKLGRMAIEAEANGVDLSRLAKISQWAEDDAKAGDPTVFKQRMETVRGLFNGAAAKLRVNDLAVVNADEMKKAGAGKPSGDIGTFSLQQASFHVSLDGLEQGNSSFRLGFLQEGVKVDPLPGPPEFMPDKIEVDLAAVKLPNAKLWQALETVLTPTTKGVAPVPGADPESIAMASAMTGLSENASEIRIEKLALSAPAASASVTGSARFDAKAVMNAVATLDISLRGLDTAIRTLQPAPGAKPDEGAKGILTALAMIQGMGQMSKNAAGQEVRNYRIELSQIGQITLNGVDMSSLIGGIGGGSPGPSGR
ncbi:putative DUF945 domain-containing protein [Azospirillaceae bacterium]